MKYKLSEFDRGFLVAARRELCKAQSLIFTALEDGETNSDAMCGALSMSENSVDYLIRVLTKMKKKQDEEISDSFKEVFNMFNSEPEEKE